MVKEQFKLGQWVVAILDPEENIAEIGIISNFSGDGWVAVKFDNNQSLWVKEDQIRPMGQGEK